MTEDLKKKVAIVKTKSVLAARKAAAAAPIGVGKKKPGPSKVAPKKEAAKPAEKSAAKPATATPKSVVGIDAKSQAVKLPVSKQTGAARTAAQPAKVSTESAKVPPQAAKVPAQPTKVPAQPTKITPPLPAAQGPAKQAPRPAGAAPTSPPLRTVPSAPRPAPSAPHLQVRTAPVVPPPPPPEPVKEEPKPKIIEVQTPIMLKDLAQKMGLRSSAIIAHLMEKTIFANITQNLGDDIVKGLLEDFGFIYQKAAGRSESAVVREREHHEEKGEASHQVTRAPVVTFMGHVDHGKTSLLDFIRKTRVADKEKGGITQHIGAYEVKYRNGSVTFLDTPGHEAFTAMRARGATATDVVVLVVAADDGVMPQTKEAVDHARFAKVPIVVAINKCDLPSANIDKVKTQLATIGLQPEDWGGKTITVPVSAKTGEGVDRLLEMLLLESELLELKANPRLRARGVVIEGRLSSGQGPVATILVKNGTLRVGDMIVSGMHYGKVKAMLNCIHERIDEVLPAQPATVLGLSGVPMAGDEVFVVKDEKKARTLCMLKQDEARERSLKLRKRVTLEDFYKRAKEDGGVKELRIIIKGDVQGSVEALQRSLEQLTTKEVQLSVVHFGLGKVNESDVMLAVVSNSVIIAFNVKTDDEAENAARKEEVEIKSYGIIYEAIADVQAAMEGLLEPVSKEVFVGRAQVRQVFRVTKVGTIAGSYVLKGKIVRTGIARLVRDKQVVYEGKLASLKRFKDDAREVAEGFECGIGLHKHDDVKEGDLIEIYQVEKIARRLTK